MREVFFLIGAGGEVLWSDASDSPVLLPDSRARWEAIWTRREAIVEIAHSHPVGPLAFSRTDETTMVALRSGLGRDYVFTVVAPNGVIRTFGGVTEIVHGPEPDWVHHLRTASRVRTLRATIPTPPLG
ncbi:MAG: Mov34/MPN/PAD-1 family protein [Labilithrix sp.]